ncbi:MAG: bifunctional riboflavin kinase/FAD synthetase [candidate division WOR-3 bacterium]
MTLLFRNISESLPKNVVMAIGIFDGVHRGHQEILRQVKQKAKELSAFSLLMTFEPHPEKVLRGFDTLKNITPFREKMRLLEGKIDGVLAINFTREFSRQHPEEFVRHYIVNPLSPREVFVGRNFTFGRDAKGTADTLGELGEKFGFKVTIIESVMVEDMMVSSSKIRELISSGDVEKANVLLGRSFYIKGIVVRGKQRRIGYPTANLRTDWELLPAKGIYAVYTLLNDERIMGVANIGNAPTFGDNELSIEVHLLDFNEDIYGRELTVEFLKKIREEVKFESVQELKRQIEKDIQVARTLFDSLKK